MELILAQIEVERERQDKKWGVQDHHFTNMDVTSCETLTKHYRGECDKENDLGVLSWRTILMEEVSEAIEEAAKGNVREFREELIQTAAVVVAMIECLDRNGL